MKPPIKLALFVAVAAASAPAMALEQISRCQSAVEFSQKVLASASGADRTGQYLKYDFSKLWLGQRSAYLGAMGPDHYRLRVALSAVSQDKTQPGRYFVQGSTLFKGHKNSFTGRITILQIRAYRPIMLGVDDEMKGKVTDQGVLIADYQFDENRSELNSGVFKGRAAASWYIDKKGQVKPDSYLAADSYANSQFTGVWGSYRSNAVTAASWGLLRIPCSGDLDVGAGEFSVNEKYRKNGW